MKRLPNILVVNDDGFHGPGLHPLIAALTPLGRVSVLVPEKERSAESHGLTLHKPLRMRDHRLGIRTLNGGPADCARLGTLMLLRGKVDLIVSGINRGFNLGQDTVYSGTVAGAMEGTLLGVPSFAISRGDGGDKDFGPAARFAAKMAVQVLRRGLPRGVCLNVNVPPLGEAQLKKPVVARLGERIYKKTITSRRDPMGGVYYWLMSDTVRGVRAPGTDVAAADSGHITITPLNADNTHTAGLAALKRWAF